MQPAEPLLGVLTPSSPGTTVAKPRPRLASLDIVRGLTVAVMVFVDETGEAWPPIDHSPWDNVTLADFVMPWFLFMVGTSLSISLRKYKTARRRGTHAVGLRALKLFGLGLLMQGGGWPNDGHFGYNLSTMRFCGILNRIGYAYFVAALIELWLPERVPSTGIETGTGVGTGAGTGRSPSAAGDAQGSTSTGRCGPIAPHLTVFATQRWRWAAASAFVILHLLLTLFTYVPSWVSHYGYNNSHYGVKLEQPFEVVCDTRGHIHTPQCSAASFFDRLLFGQDHLGTWMSKRLPECSSCSPARPNSMYFPHCHLLVNVSAGDPAWCFAHMYDAEGALATVPTVMSVWIGAHYGRVLRFDGLSAQVLVHWLACSTVLIAAGLALHFEGLPMNKQLWSTSYLFFMAGTCGAALAAVYALVDAKPPQERRWRWLNGVQSRARKVCFPLEAMGMNAIFFFVWHGTAETLINAFFVQPPVPPDQDTTRTTLLGEDGWIRETALSWVGGPADRQMVFVLLKIGCYLLVAVLCHRWNYFWKL